jgi:hypothetical protein
MLARTLNDFFAGFFYDQIKADLEVNMANTRQNDDRRKGIRRESSRRKTDIKTIKIEGKAEKEQEVTVRTETALQKKAGSVWGWHEEFAAEWSGTFLTKKRGKYPRKGE